MTTAITFDNAPTMSSPMSPPARGPDRSDEQVLSALPSAVGCAQRFARYTLEQWQLQGLAEQAEAVVATLVGDAVARTGIVVEHPGYADLYGKTLNLLAVRLRVIGERVLIEVRDDDAAPPWPRDEKEPVAQPGHRTLGARRVGYGLGSTGGTVARFELDISLAGTLDDTQPLGLPLRIPARLRPVAAPDRSIDVERDPHVLRRVLNGLHQVRSATPHLESSAANLPSHQEDN
jgi:hypothetical protein